MENTIRYPEYYAPVAEEEMVYLTGGGICPRFPQSCTIVLMENTQNSQFFQGNP